MISLMVKIPRQLSGGELQQISPLELRGFTSLFHDNGKITTNHAWIAIG
jgi:hypothetical protein